MSIGSVQVNNLNLMQGETTEVERLFLFIGASDTAKTNAGKCLSVNTDTDLDSVLGGDSNLKKQVTAALNNAGQNWTAHVFPLDGVLTWDEAVDYCMELVSPEAIALTDPVTASTDWEDMQTKAENLMAQYMRPVFFTAATRGIDAENEAWSDFTAAIKPLVTDIAADQVSPVATLWGNELGTYCGRLCNRSVTVADSPMRVATGNLVGEWSERPVDKNGRVLDMSIIKELATARYSVPQWYPDYPGVYWADGAVLDVPSGDYQVIENVRVVQKAMRKVYSLIVARIADRKLNSTPNSIAQNKTYFMRPLREMSKSVTIMGTTFPGEIKPPKDADITIKWPTKYAVEIYMVVRPYNCPKSITCNIMLDLTNYATE